MSELSITLKGLKVLKAASEDSLAFEATIYVDGKRLAVATDDGGGGMTVVNPAKGKTRDDVAAVEEQLKAYPDIPVPGLDSSWPSEWKADDLNLSLGDVVATIANQLDALKDMRAHLKRRITGYDREKAQILEWSTPYTEMTAVRLVEKFPSVIVLNGLDENEALKYWTGQHPEQQPDDADRNAEPQM